MNTYTEASPSTENLIVILADGTRIAIEFQAHKSSREWQESMLKAGEAIRRKAGPCRISSSIYIAGTAVSVYGGDETMEVLGLALKVEA